MTTEYTVLRKDDPRPECRAMVIPGDYGPSERLRPASLGCYEKEGWRYESTHPDWHSAHNKAEWVRKGVL